MILNDKIISRIGDLFLMPTRLSKNLARWHENMRQMGQNLEITNDDGKDQRTWTMSAKRLWKIAVSLLHLWIISATDKETTEKIILFLTSNSLLTEKSISHSMTENSINFTVRLECR